MRCRLLFLRFGGSQVTTQLTAASVWCHLFMEASRRKRNGQQCIRIYHLLSIQFCTVKEFPFPNLRKNLPSIQTKRTKASHPRVLLSRRRLLNHVSHGMSSAPQPHILTQDKLNDLVRDWSCPKAKQLLGSKTQTMESSREKCPNFFVSQSSAVGALLQKGR